MATNPPGQYPTSSGDRPLAYVDETAGSGWLFFAGTVLGLAGLMRIIDSIWAFNYNGALPDQLQDGVLGSKLTTYAWLWLVVGVLLLAVSVDSISRRGRESAGRA